MPKNNNNNIVILKTAVTTWLAVKAAESESNEVILRPDGRKELRKIMWNH